MMMWAWQVTPDLLLCFCCLERKILSDFSLTFYLRAVKSISIVSCLRMQLAAQRARAVNQRRLAARSASAFNVDLLSANCSGDLYNLIEKPPHCISCIFLMEKKSVVILTDCRVSEFHEAIAIKLSTHTPWYIYYMFYKFQTWQIGLF